MGVVRHSNEKHVQSRGTLCLCFAVHCGPECDKMMDGDQHLCHCSGNETSFPIKDRPRIVYLTFDDAFTAQAESQFYRGLFNGTFKNPNGCAIRATHFITQSYTDYELVNQYWHMRWPHTPSRTEMMPNIGKSWMLKDGKLRWLE